MKSPGRGASTQGSDDAFPGWTSGVWKKREAVRHLWGNRLLLSLFYTVPLLPAAALGCQGCHFYNYPPLYILTTLPLLDPAHRLFSSNPFFRAGKRNFPLSVLPNFPGILPLSPTTLLKTKINPPPRLRLNLPTKIPSSLLPRPSPPMPLGLLPLNLRNNMSLPSSPYHSRCRARHLPYKRRRQSALLPWDRALISRRNPV